MKLVTTKFKSGGLHEKHVAATWSLGNHLYNIRQPSNVNSKTDIVLMFVTVHFCEYYCILLLRDVYDPSANQISEVHVK